MRILLINANRFKHPWPVIPFGLMCVASVLERAGHAIRVLDLCFSRNCLRDLRTAIAEHQPELVGVSIRNIDNSAGYNTLFLLEQTRNEVIIPLKQLFPGPIVIGGPAVGISGAEILEFMDLPYAIRGDGELAMAELANLLAQGRDPLGLPGLVIRRGGQLLQDSPPSRVPDLNGLPTPNPGRYIDLKPYRAFNSPLQVQTKRGCALDCTYCTYNEIEGRRYRLRDPELVAREIHDLTAATGIEHVEFTDSTFNVPLKHCKEVLRALVRLGNMNLKMRTMGLNPGFVDEELVDLMQKAGFMEVDLGAEAGSEAMLRSLGKNFNKEDVLRAGRLLQEKNIPVTWYLLVGAPGETRETLRETFDTVNKAASKWDLINVGVGVRVYRGAPMARDMLAENPHCTADNFLRPVHCKPGALSLEQVKLLTKQEALKHPNYFMYDEDENTPELVLRMGVALLKLFAPNQPLFRLHILLRTIQKCLGIGLVKRKLFAWRYRARLQ